VTKVFRFVTIKFVVNEAKRTQVEVSKPSPPRDDPNIMFISSSGLVTVLRDVVQTKAMFFARVETSRCI